MNKPALYTTANTPQRLDVAYFSDEFGKEIGKMSGRCLDVGSGPGDTVVDLILPKLNAEASLVCSDISEKMLNFAKEKYKNNERLTFVKLDIESSNLANDLVEQFDHVTSFYCLHWCQNMRQVFENMFNLLQPGGSAFLIFVANSPGLNAYEKLAAMPRYQPYMKDADRYIPVFQHSDQPSKTLNALINDAGFEVHHCSVREKRHVFDSLNALSKFALAINPFVKRIPANLMEEYEKDLVYEFAAQNIIFNKNNNNEDERSILFIHSVFIVYAKKPSATCL